MKQYLSLVKFSHTIFALPFALVGFFLGVQQNAFEFHWFTLVLVVFCMVFARNAAMAFNRYADAKIDAANPRTATREIPAGIIKPQHALLFICVNCALFITTTYFINSLCFYLSPIALMIILGYSITKRFTVLCHVVLGIGLSLAPIGAYLAVTGVFHWLPILFSLVVLTWVAGFDIIYALQDESFDKGVGLHSIPSFFGKKGALIVSALLHIVCGVVICLAGYYGSFSWIYWIGAALFNILLVYQHILVKPDDLSKVNKAFFTTNGIASVIFAAFLILDLVLHNTSLFF